MAASVTAARGALFDILTDLQATTLEGVKIERTGRFQDTPEHEIITVGMPESGDRESRRLGGIPYDETYVIPVHIQAVKQGGAGIEAVEERLWALVRIVDAAVLANGRLNDTVVRALPGGWSDAELRANDQWIENRLTLDVDVLAHVDLAAA